MAGFSFPQGDQGLASAAAGSIRLTQLTGSEVVIAQNNGARLTTTTTQDIADLATSNQGTVINVLACGAKGDLAFATGAFSWSGNTVTVTGAVFSTTDIGKAIILPAGANSAGISVPVTTSITGVISPISVTVAASSAHAVSAATTALKALAAPDSVVVNSPGVGDRVGDMLTLTGGTFARPGSLRVMMTKVLTATIANAGSLGPAGPITLTGTTGQGKRVQVSGTVGAGGSLTGPVSVAVQGQYWIDISTPAAEPVTAYPLAHSALATFTSSSTSVTVDSADGMLVGNPIAAVGIPAGTTVTVIVGTTLTISQATTASGTNVSCTVTNNSLPVYTTATFTSGSMTVLVASATGLSIGMAVAGTGVSGSGDPTQSTSTRITGISGTTVTLSQATTEASPTPVSFTAFPMLTGAVLSLTAGVHTATISDVGLYSTLPSFPAGVSGGMGAGATFTPPTTSILVPYGTDDTAAINVAYAKARAVAAVAAPLDEYDGSFTVEWPPGNYLCLSPVNATSIKSGGYKVISNGAVLYSAASGGIAYDAFNSRWTLMDGPLLIYGDQSFPPRVGFAAGVTGNGGADSLNYDGLLTTGRFTLTGAYLIGTETSTFKDCRFWNHHDAQSSYGLILDGTHHWDVSSTFQPQLLPFDTIIQPFTGLLTPNIDIRVFGGSPLWVTGVSEARLEGYCANYGPPGVMLKAGLVGGGGGCVRPEFLIHFETTRTQDAFFIFCGNSNAAFGNGLIYVDGGSQAANSLFSVDAAGNFGAAITVLLILGSTMNVGFMEPGARVWDRPDLVNYIGAATFGDTVPAIAWNTPSFFNGSLILNRKLTVLFGGLNVGASGLGVGGDVNVSGLISARGALSGASLTLGPAGAAPSVSAGTDANGNLTLGRRGTGGFPSSSTPYIDYFGPGNIGAVQDARLIVGSAGTLSVVGPATGQAALEVLGGMSSYYASTPWVNAGTLANGGTITLPTPSAAGPRRGMVIVSGSIATGTLVLPAATITPNGYNAQFATTGTIGALTVVAADSAAINGAPTALSSSTPGRLVFHTETSPNAWYPA